MDKTTLTLGLAGLLLLLVVLVSIYIGSARAKKAVAASHEAVATFEETCAVIHQNTSSNAQINGAVDTIIEHYPHIDDFRVYGALLQTLCVHPSTDSKVILRFQKALIAANPNVKDQIEKTLKLGLAGRK